jgi:hypothetical protein
MPTNRFFFDLYDDGEFFPDREGTDLPTMQAAEREAVRALGDMVGDLHKVAPKREITIEARNTEGVAFRAAILFRLDRLK